MPTNEERRVIANELRHTASHSLNGYSFQRSVEGTVFGTIGDRPWRKTLTRLADLIEPEPERTCQQVLAECNDGLMPPFTASCSECGANWGYTPKYCPECGAKVVWE